MHKAGTGQVACSLVMLSIFLPSVSFGQTAGVSLSADLAASSARYTWMFPKTVVDTTIVYTFDGCFDPDHPPPGGPAPGGAVLHLKITPTLAARALPDTYVGRRGVLTGNLASWWQDQNITLKTFPVSHIISSIGSAPVNQTAQIISNVLTGVTKLVAVGLGVPPVGLAAVKSRCGTANDSWAKLKGAQKSIQDLQTALAAGVDDATQKKYTAQIQALQTVVTTLQGDLTLTIKKTVDPGYSPIDINKVSAEEPELYHNPKSKPAPIAGDGLVAIFKPTDQQITDAHWYKSMSDLDDREKALLEVSMYLDFPNSYPPISPNPDGKYGQAPVGSEYIYRDVAYIPVVLWRGEKGQPSTTGDSDGAPLGAIQLNAPQAIAFGQYGEAQQLPLSVDAFKNLRWSITFLENGEVTDATFSSKAAGVALTGLFGNVATAANSIATEQRNAVSASIQANAPQTEADKIYQEHRLAICRANPSNCPSK